MKVEHQCRRSRELIAWAAENGWSAEKTRGGHIRFTREGKTVFGASTPGSKRTLHNLRALLRRRMRQP